MVDANLKSFTKNNQEPHSNDTKQTGFESVILLVAILQNNDKKSFLKTTIILRDNAKAYFLF